MTQTARRCDAKRAPLQLFQPLLEKKQNQITVTLTDGPLHIPLDGPSLTQILLNLLANANRHTRAGHIEIGAQQDGEQSWVWVRDDGEGMAPELARRVFDRQVSGPADQSSGLGLSICREIVEAAGGTMGLTSAPEQGTRVWMILPAAHKEGHRDA